MKGPAHRINQAVKERDWKPIKIVRICTHLFFVDNIILFVEARSNHVQIIQKVLNVFCECSGQKVNLSKSLLHVSSNVIDQRAKEISDCFGIQLTNDLGKYLGMPSIHGRVHSNTFKFLLDKVYGKLASCK